MRLLSIGLRVYQYLDAVALSLTPIFFANSLCGEGYNICHLKKIVLAGVSLLLVLLLNTLVIYGFHYLLVKAFNWYINFHWLLVLIIAFAVGYASWVILILNTLLTKFIQETLSWKLTILVIGLLLCYCGYQTWWLWTNRPVLETTSQKFAFVMCLLDSLVCWYMVVVSIISIKSKTKEKRKGGRTIRSKGNSYQIDGDSNESKPPSKILEATRKLTSNPNLSSDEMTNMVQSGVFGYSTKPNENGSAIYYNQEWMFAYDRAMLFMIEIPLNHIVKSKAEVIERLPDRIQRLIIQSRMFNEKPEKLIEDILNIPIHYFNSENTTKELVQIILNSDYFATWSNKFLYDTPIFDDNLTLTPEEAYNQFEETTLYQYLTELSSC